VADEQLDVAGLQIGVGQDVVLDDLFLLGAGGVLRLLDGVEEPFGGHRRRRDHHVAGGIPYPLLGHDAWRGRDNCDRARQRGAIAIVTAAPSVMAEEWVRDSAGNMMVPP